MTGCSSGPEPGAYRMWRTEEGSTGRLVQLCVGYFVFYAITGVTVKYFLSTGPGRPGLEGLEFLVYSTAGGTSIALGAVLALRWYRIDAEPRALLYIIPSGICTAVVIPTTTLMYTLPITVMVAMVIMRGSVIIISRLVDAIQIRQGILHREVYWQENAAVALALSAVATHLLVTDADGGKFDFLGNAAAMTILGSYIGAYSLRIYIMNYFKNTRPPGAKQDTTGFYAVEQIAAVVTLAVVLALVFFSPTLFGASGPRIETIRSAITAPPAPWPSAILAGMAFGVVSFFSVFIFMFKGRTATFAGLVNRLTSLVAGTTATLIFSFGFGGRSPKLQDWISLGFILVAVAFLTRAERRRARELAPSGPAVTRRA